MMTKETFEELLKEYAEVSARLQALHAFITDEEKIKDLDQINRDLLITQMNAMGAYSSVLRIRLGVNNRPEFSEPNESETTDTEEKTESAEVSE